MGTLVGFVTRLNGAMQPDGVEPGRFRPKLR